MQELSARGDEERIDGNWDPYSYWAKLCQKWWTHLMRTGASLLALSFLCTHRKLISTWPVTIFSLTFFFKTLLFRGRKNVHWHNSLKSFPVSFMPRDIFYSPFAWTLCKCEHGPALRRWSQPACCSLPLEPTQKALQSAEEKFCLERWEHVRDGQHDKMSSHPTMPLLDPARGLQRPTNELRAAFEQYLMIFLIFYDFMMSWKIMIIAHWRAHL